MNRGELRRQVSKVGNESPALQTIADLASPRQEFQDRCHTFPPTHYILHNKVKQLKGNIQSVFCLLSIFKVTDDAEGARVTAKWILDDSSGRQLRLGARSGRLSLFSSLSLSLDGSVTLDFHIYRLNRRSCSIF